MIKCYWQLVKNEAAVSKWAKKSKEKTTKSVHEAKILVDYCIFLHNEWSFILGYTLGP